MMQQILARLSELFSPSHVGQLLAEKIIPNLVVAIIATVVFVLVGRVALAGLSRALGRSRLDETAQTFVIAVARTLVYALGAVTVAAQVGIDTTSLVTSLGVAGLTLGFAARDTLSNLISGLFIFWDRPFVLDDLVEIDGQYGRVAEITMRTTRVVTPDGRMLAVPNTTVVNSTVASYTNFPNLRLDVPITIAVDEPIGRARALLLATVADDPEFINETPAEVIVTALNDYNVELQLRAWIRDERRHIALRALLRERMFDALNAAGVQMPYETFEVRPSAA